MSQSSHLLPLTRQLIDALLMDVWPSIATCVDFGMTSQQHYEALQQVVKLGEVTPEQLDDALGNGPELTALVIGCKHNRHPGIVFTTPYDHMGPEED